VNADIRFHRDGNLVALADERLLVFVRTGLLTVPALETMEGLKASVLASPKPKGVLAIFTATAGVSHNSLVERQRVFVRGIASEVPDISFAVVVLGDTVHAIAIRTVLRLFVMGRSNMAAFRDVGEGSRWLAGRMGIDAATLERTAAGLVTRC
jgi:hypothetical protein